MPVSVPEKTPEQPARPLLDLVIRIGQAMFLLSVVGTFATVGAAIARPLLG